MTTALFRLASTLITLATFTMGCGSDPPPAAIAPTGATAAPGTAPAPATTPPASTTPDACSEIAGACHEHDAKGGAAASVIHECHELGHAHKLEACVSRKQQCLDACAGHAH